MLPLLLLTLALTQAQAAESPSPVTVYVTSAGARNGFTDPDKGSADTVRDLKELIGRKRFVGHTPSLVLTDDREHATLVVIVAGREATGSISMGRDRVIRVKLLYAQQEAELSAARAGGTVGSAGAWREAAEKLVKQLDKWVKDNRAKLTKPATGVE